jgi:hypothetical protein
MTPGALPDPTAVAATVTRQLERLGIRYVIGGSFASSLHGEPRSTNDVDIVADLDQRSAVDLVQSLGPEFYADRDAAIEAVRSNASFNVVHVATAVKIDIFVAGTDALDQERLQRRQRVTVAAEDASESFFVDTAEDVVLRKLEWFRRGGEVSERQWRDVIAVLRVRRELNHEYLLEWATRLGVADLLKRAMEVAAAA